MKEKRRDCTNIDVQVNERSFRYLKGNMEEKPQDTKAKGWISAIYIYIYIHIDIYLGRNWID